MAETADYANLFILIDFFEKEYIFIDKKNIKKENFFYTKNIQTICNSKILIEYNLT